MTQGPIWRNKYVCNAQNCKIQKSCYLKYHYMLQFEYNCFKMYPTDQPFCDKLGQTQILTIEYGDKKKKEVHVQERSEYSPIPFYICYPKNNILNYVAYECHF